MERRLHTLPENAVRGLLRRLRDLNLSGHRIAVRRGETITLSGCLSLYAGVESGVRYRLVDGRGAEAVLVLVPRAGALEARIDGMGDVARLAIPCASDELGRTTLPAVGARIGASGNDPRALARVMRRVVRRLCAA